MELPMELRSALAAADDAYLIGLSNKGTLNRAKKDLQSMTLEARAEGERMTVTVGTETCTICTPLGDSACSCPSTSMCRHRLAAMLWLRDQVGSELEEKVPQFRELLAYPTEKLTKQLGPKRLAGILFRHQSGAGPMITESSVVSVELSWLGVNVRLLEPLEHSTCSCKSKSFCLHRAEALLFWQLSKGIAKAEELEPKTLSDAPDPERVRGVCASVCEMLTEQLVTGLSRMPESVCDTVERMASLSHTAGLPSLERALRNLHGEYAACFSRSATFREGALLSRLSHAFRLASALESADEDRLRSLAGTFREDYARTSDLKLYLLGYRSIGGRSGYGGTAYYFLERETFRFYCYRDIRPTFYEQARRRGDAAPWSLPCTLKQAWNYAIDLAQPRVNASGGLSATKDCQGTLMGPKKPWEVILADRVVTNFETLLPISSPHRRETERLAIIRPRKWELRAFDHVNQVYTMRLFDRQERDIWLEVGYRKEEEPVIKRLESLGGQMELGTASPVFFGEVYRDGDKLKLYPIECWSDWREAP